MRPGVLGGPQEVGKVIEVIGAKVSAVTKVDEEEADCEVIGRNKKLVNLISSIYSCKIPKRGTQRKFRCPG